VTPLQVAKQECANCDSAGNCSAVGIRDDGSLYLFRREGEKCWLAPGPDGAIARCPYFEQCIAPLAQARLRNAGTTEQKHAARRLAEGVLAYEKATFDTTTAKYAKCKGCQRDVIAPKRFCPSCAKRRKLQSNNRSRIRKNRAFGALITKDL
jgi:hypothetical protein